LIQQSWPAGHYGLGAVGTTTYITSGEAALVTPAPSHARDLRTLGGAMAIGAVALPVLPDVGPLCPLRRLTGVPCPFCGMTTGVLALSRGDVLAAFAANPVAPLLVAAVVLSFLPFVYRSRPFREGSERVRRVGRVGRAVPWLLLPLLWVWELHRFDRI
jgi:hypothetical protein